MRSCRNSALRALACVSGVAIAGSAYAANGATPEALTAQAHSATKAGDASQRLDPATAPRFFDASSLRGLDDDREIADRFGLRVPVYPGTVCTTENPDTCFDWDLTSTNFIIAFNDVFEVIDSIYLVRNDFNAGNVEVSQLCFGTFWVDGGFLSNDPLNPFDTNYRVTFYPSDGVTNPGTNFPDVGAPIAEFVEGTPGPGQQAITAVNFTYNERFGGQSDLVHLVFPAVTLQADVCYWIGVQNDTSATQAARASGPYGGVLVDNSFFQDSDQNGSFSEGERNEGDLGWCVYGIDVPDPGMPETDYFLDFGDPALGGGACYVNTCAPEATNLTCQTAIDLVVGDITPSNGLCNVSLGAVGDEALNCPIFINGIDDIDLARGVWFTVTGDGTTFTVDTTLPNAMSVVADTAVNVYCNAQPTEPDCSILYCLAADSDFAGNGNNLPALFSFATTPGEVYYLLVHQSSADEFNIQVTSDGIAGACDTFNCAPIVIDCPDDSNTDELALEPCDDLQPESGNDGCNAAIPALPGSANPSFVTLPVGEIICGTMNRVGGGSDLDWYYLDLQQDSILTLSLLAEQPNSLLVFDLNDKDDGAGGVDPTGCTNVASVAVETAAFLGATSFNERGAVNDLVIALPAGEYSIVARPVFGNGYEYTCAGGEVDYQLLVDIEAVAAVPAGGTLENGGANKCTPTTNIVGIGRDFNRGCVNSDAAGVAPLPGDGDYRGLVGVSATTGIRDADAWEFTIASETLVTFELTSQFPAFAGFIDKNGGTCDTFFRFGSDRFALPAGEANLVQAVLPAGTYHFVVSPQASDDPSLFADIICGGFANEYFFTYTSQPACGSLSVPAGAIAETEDWCLSGDVNSGCEPAIDACSMSPGATFAADLMLGDSATGTIGGNFDGTAGTASRDIDAWRFTLASTETVTIDVDAAFPILVTILDVADCDNIGVVGTASLFADCSNMAGTIEIADLPAGTYAVSITADFGLVDCNANAAGYEYWFTIDAGGGGPVCGPADTTTTGTSNGIPDGVVDLSDFSFYLAQWGASNPAADLTTTGTSNGIPDGTVDLSDFSFYLGLWGAGCP